MGLLSDPEYGSVKWVKVLKKVHAPLCFLCFVGAIAWFVMLGNREFNNETYFSENALLPGLVTNEFNAEQSAKQYYSEYMNELQSKYEDTDEIPVPWLVGKMSQLHLEVYTHNFTLNYPLGFGQVFTGTNVYGILRAARTPSLEALVVSVPYRPLSSHQKGTAAGIALMMAFAQFARPQKYWAKDIIFLVTEHEQLGMQAWLEAYHGIQSDAGNFYTSLGSFWAPGTPSLDFKKFVPGFGSWGPHQKCLDPGKLKGRSGSIQAAINLELHVPKIKYIEVKVEGLNGQLPNLDLVNLVHKLCVKSGIHHSYKNSYSWIRGRNKMDEWVNNIKTMLSMVTTQMAGIPNGNHGLFHRFNIEAVTLEGRDAGDAAGAAPRVATLSSANFYRLGVALESILRSLNNLLERFHQSYFFYLLAATNRFISIGQYMPSLCLLCVAMLIRALYLWVSIQQDEDDDKQTNKTNKQLTKKTHKNSDDEDEQTNTQKDKKEKLSEQKVPGDNKSKKVKTKKIVESSVGVFKISMLANYLLVHVLGYAVMNTPFYFSAFGAEYFEERTEASVYYGLSAVSVLLVLITPFLPRLLHQGPITHEEMSLINILLLVELATACLTMGMHNFSLGLVVAVIYTPLALISGVVTKKSRSIPLFLRRALCLLLQPLCMMSISMITYSHMIFPEDTVWTTLARGRDAVMQAVLFSIVDCMIYGNWLFNVVLSSILPMWMLFWQILWVKVSDRR